MTAYENDTLIIPEKYKRRPCYLWHSEHAVDFDFCPRVIGAVCCYFYLLCMRDYCAHPWTRCPAMGHRVVCFHPIQLCCIYICQHIPHLLNRN